MKLSEKYLQSRRNGHGGLCLGEYEAEVLMEICRLEGKQEPQDKDFLSMAVTTQKLEKIAKENNL